MQNDDPVLRQTHWTPLARSGHGWPTHRLVVHASEGWAELRPNVPLHRPLLILSEVSGLVLLLWQFITDGQGSAVAMLTMLLIATPIFGFTLRTVVFDRRSGRFWEQRLVAPSKRFMEGRLSGIHAIQLIPERVITGDTTGLTGPPAFFVSYELNLVNHRGGRLNLIDHVMLGWLRRDAHRLAQFLDVPLWDITGDSDDAQTMNELKMQVLDNIR